MIFEHDLLLTIFVTGALLAIAILCHVVFIIYSAHRTGFHCQQKTMSNAPQMRSVNPNEAQNIRRSMKRDSWLDAIFTLIVALIGIAIMIAPFYIAWHFIVKYW